MNKSTTHLLRARPGRCLFHRDLEVSTSFALNGTWSPTPRMRLKAPSENPESIPVSVSVAFVPFIVITVSQRRKVTPPFA